MGLRRRRERNDYRDGNNNSTDRRRRQNVAGDRGMVSEVGKKRKIYVIL